MSCVNRDILFETPYIPQNCRGLEQEVRVVYISACTAVTYFQSAATYPKDSRESCPSGEALISESKRPALSSLDKLLRTNRVLWRTVDFDQ